MDFKDFQRRPGGKTAIETGVEFETEVSEITLERSQSIQGVFNFKKGVSFYV